MIVHYLHPTKKETICGLKPIDIQIQCPERTDTWTYNKKEINCDDCNKKLSYGIIQNDSNTGIMTAIIPTRGVMFLPGFKNPTIDQPEES